MPATTTTDIDDDAILDLLLPRVLPIGWETVKDFPNVFRHDSDKLAAVVTLRKDEDGRRWVHISVSHRDRLPTWEELRRTRDLLIGKDKAMIQVLHPVGLHPRSIHLLYCVDGCPVPDFEEKF